MDLVVDPQRHAIIPLQNLCFLVDQKNVSKEIPFWSPVSKMQHILMPSCAFFIHLFILRTGTGWQKVTDSIPAGGILWFGE